MPGPLPVDATTRFLAEREWVHFGQAIRQPELGLQHQPGVLQCLDNLRPDDFAPTVARLLRLALTEPERQQANDFFTSRPGQALSQAVLASLRGDAQAWQRMQDSLDVADLQAQLRFTQSAAGRRVLQDLGPDARVQLRELLMDRIASCRVATRA
ncbi:hypothetical protein CCO03_17485 [Comamonas serinivorans]|uniref:DUF2059 domain-containing protein n=1 Tax=Comamonas serinivorans TaxID=1082851 RepID=A0A1Y0ES80_9BURK|nr:DUF2059 domain-containing protein [Comamonas serinivorans]ARU06231.1 hypothetical protein CCO03_17485 [Comamonas serinivorans]